MTTIKDAGELLPLLREARKTGRIKLAMTDRAMEQVIMALHLCETVGRNPNLPKLAQEIENVRYQNMAYAFDVRSYVECVHHMILDGSPCDFCEDQKECQRDCKGGKGCIEWWLRYSEGVTQ